MSMGGAIKKKPSEMKKAPVYKPLGTEREVVMDTSFKKDSLDYKLAKAAGIKDWRDKIDPAIIEEARRKTLKNKARVSNW